MNCRCENNVYLKDKTWIHRGGVVNAYYSPCSVDELVEVATELYNNNTVFLTIGHTSNIYFKNSFNIDAIIDTRRLVSFRVLDTNTLCCDCGVHMSKLSQYCVENGFEGYEGMINLPGTVGGAIVNNSGCYNCGIDKVLKSIDLLTPNGNVVNLTNKELGYTFRNSDLKNGKRKGVVLRAYLDISKKGDIEKLKAIALHNTRNRKETQDSPAYNLGTVINAYCYKINWRNIIIGITSKCLYYVVKDANKRSITLKKLILFLYGKRFLIPYISDKRMQCFLWKDEQADLYFDDFLKLMRTIYKTGSIEIEIFE